MSIFDKLQSADLVRMIEREMEMLRNSHSADCQHAARQTEASPNDPEAWFQYGLLSIQEGIRYEQLALEKAHQEYLQNHPDTDPDAEIELELNIPELAQFYAQAIECFDKVLEIEPDYYGVRYQQGIIYANMGNVEQAERYFLMALEDDPEDFSAAQDLAQLYMDQGKDDLAQKYLKMIEE